MSTERQVDAGNRSTVRLDSRQIQVLAHPLRGRLLGLLRTDGPATATALARSLATNTGATSYHLRQLAEVGLVVEEPDRGTGRQRWWRAAHEFSSWEPADFDDDPDARAASDWIQHHQVHLMADQAQRWITAQHDYPKAWRQAASISDYPLRLSPARMRALQEEISTLVERYRNEPDTTEPDTEQALLFVAGFPRVRDAR